jgi:permuted papain-like amidase YaeF/Yiix C92 family enzyme
MAQVLDIIGRIIARYLERPVQGYDPFTPSDPVTLRKSLEPGDVLLVEGNSHISRVIKYLTQSTWSHAALYVGPIKGANTRDGEPHVLIEAEIGQGVISAPLSKYFPYHTRICRPIGLSLEDRRTVCSYAIDRIGFDYDLRNIIDLMRYLFPLPVPQRWRRRMIALGSGNPTRLICSALIAQAFEAVRYPILPKITQLESEIARREILHIRDSSLYVPRDFDISPYFKIVKPMLESFDYKHVHWADLPAQSEQYIGTSRTRRKMRRQRCAQLRSTPDGRSTNIRSPSSSWPNAQVRAAGAGAMENRGPGSECLHAPVHKTVVPARALSLQQPRASRHDYDTERQS